MQSNNPNLDKIVRFRPSCKKKSPQTLQKSTCGFAHKLSSSNETKTKPSTRAGHPRCYCHPSQKEISLHLDNPTKAKGVRHPNDKQSRKASPVPNSFTYCHRPCGPSLQRSPGVDEMHHRRTADHWAFVASSSRADEARPISHYQWMHSARSWWKWNTSRTTASWSREAWALVDDAHLPPTA